MVMALGATNLQPQKHLAHGGGQLVEDRMPPLRQQVDVGHVGARQAEPRGRAGRFVLGERFIAGQLPQDKLVIRHVGIERGDHPVAVAPGVAANLVVFEAVGLCKAGQIKPVLRRTLAKTRRVQQAVDKLRHRIRPFIQNKLINLPGCRRQPRQIETQTTDQRFASSERLRLQSAFLQPCQHERINGMTAPSRIVVNVRHVRQNDGTKRPVLTIKRIKRWFAVLCAFVCHPQWQHHRQQHDDDGTTTKTAEPDVLPHTVPLK